MLVRAYNRVISNLITMRLCSLFASSAPFYYRMGCGTCVPNIPIIDVLQSGFLDNYGKDDRGQCVILCAAQQRLLTAAMVEIGTYIFWYVVVCCEA